MRTRPFTDSSRTVFNDSHTGRCLPEETFIIRAFSAGREGALIQRMYVRHQLRMLQHQPPILFSVA
jgi:hypothetical protein